MAPQSPVESLIATLDALIAVLHSDGDQHWSAWLQRSKSLAETDPVAGAKHLLGAYGGMGSFNDVVLGQHYVNGHFAWKPGYGELNQQFDMLRGQAWTQARQIVQASASVPPNTAH